MTRILWTQSTFFIIVFSISALMADKPVRKAEPAVVDMFEAMKADMIDVRVVAKDSTTGNVLFKNKTKQVLSIRLPDAFAEFHL